uniref:Uncharacterized protein n=1 Tax=Agrobacterium tumefaciens TaxID=358 RepID=K7WUN3_AGRTU|nr:Hypothetical protein [Agrobacterium radiobacter]
MYPRTPLEPAAVSRRISSNDLFRFQAPLWLATQRIRSVSDGVSPKA